MGSFRLVACALILAPVLAFAQPQPKPTNIQKAGELVKLAIAKSQAGDHMGAIDMYLNAYQLVPQPILLSNIGSEYQQAGKPVDALKYFCNYLKEDPTGTNASYATAQAKVLQIQLGNQVEDDKDVCKPQPPPKPKEPPPETTKPDVPPPPEAGATKDTGESPEHPGRGLRIGGMALGIAGIAVLAVGGYYAYKGYSLSSQISDHKSGAWPTTIDGVSIDQWDSTGKKYNSNAWTYSIIGAVVAGGGIAMYVIGHGKDKPANEEHAVLVPVASPTGFGLALSGGF